MAGRILLTGASSFTGLWIAEALAQAGFEVLAPLPRAREDYAGVRLDRVERLARWAEVRFAAPFGSAALLDLVAGAGRIDLLGQHGAHIFGYRDPAFDPIDALARNTAGAPALLAAVGKAGAKGVMLTGSVFEAGEGGASDNPAVTPYGLSKTLTRAAYAYWAKEAGLPFAAFVIPSPYGSYEEARFGWYLFRTWFAGEMPLVRTPAYLRDHVAAPQLARANVDAARADLAGGAPSVFRPSGWQATQGDFAQKVAAEARARLDLPCPLTLADQTAFDEPRVRVNAEPIPTDGWDEAAFWEAYVGWYAGLHAQGRLA
jgi:nucleoside-diphosphate-sugar epimerase